MFSFDVEMLCNSIMAFYRAGARYLSLSVANTDFSAFSTRPTQDAQFMLSTGKVTMFRVAGPFLTGAFMAISFRN